LSKAGGSFFFCRRGWIVPVCSMIMVVGWNAGRGCFQWMGEFFRWVLIALTFSEIFARNALTFIDFQF
jgi:hypothetical protein